MQKQMVRAHMEIIFGVIELAARCLTYLHGSTRITSVVVYGSMQMAQQSLSMSLVSSDLMLFVGIFAMTRFATVQSWRYN